MIGSIKIMPANGFGITAELNDVGLWSCPDPEVAMYLNLLWSPRAGMAASPAYGPFGDAVVRLAAIDVGGQALVPLKPPPSGDVIFALTEEEERSRLLADILGGILGDVALAAFDADEEVGWVASFSDDDGIIAEVGPRGGKRWKYKGDARWRYGDPPTRKADKVAAAREAIGKAKGKIHTPESAKELLEHLKNLTVKQLQEVKKEHNLPVSARLRSELLSQIHNTIQAAGPEKPPVSVSTAVSGMRSAIAGALSALGDKADLVARDIGLVMNKYTISHAIAKNTGMDTKDADALVPTVTDAMVKHLQAHGVEPPNADLWSTAPRRLTDMAEIQKAFQEVQDQKKKGERKFAEENHDAPPAPETVTSREWVALKMRQRIEVTKKDFAKLDKLYQKYRAIEDGYGKDPDYHQKMNDFDKESSTPSLQRLKNKYRPSYQDKRSTVSLTAAQDTAKARLSNDEQAFAGGYFDKYSPDNVKAYDEHREAVKEAANDPSKKLSEKVLEDVLYEDWLPKRYRDQYQTKLSQEQHQKYMENEHNYFNGLLQKVMPAAEEKLAPLMAKAMEFPAKLTEARVQHAEATKHYEELFAKLTDANKQVMNNPNNNAKFIIERDQLRTEFKNSASRQMLTGSALRDATIKYGREWLKPLLPNASNDRATMPDAAHLDATGRDNLAKANEFLKGAVGANWEPKSPTIEKIANGGWRAYHAGDSIHVRPAEDAATFIHEYGHHLEGQNGNTLGSLSRAWAMTQLQKHGQKPEHLGAQYEASEIGAEDGFKSPYTGKFYNHNSSEVLSMGVQHLYEDPVSFYEKSPDHFKYTLAALHGFLT